MWIHSLTSQRLMKGQFHKLFEDLCVSPTKFQQYFRMSKSSFDDLLNMIRQYITYNDTNMRQAVRPEKRLDDNYVILQFKKLHLSSILIKLKVCVCMCVCVCV